MRILICGDRNWTDFDAVRQEISRFPKDTVIIHGAARGADTIAGLVAEAFGLEMVVFPARWELYGKAAGPIRNKQMLTDGRPDEVLAFHDDIAHSKGTKNMVKIAQESGILTRIWSHNCHS